MNKIIVVVGPTAVGKTKISIELAKRLGLEIISGDSVAVYKKLNIGSAKPTTQEMDGVVHHLIDIIEPTSQYDVSSFQRDARQIIEEKKNVIICGGTGLYIQSVLFDYDFSSPKRNEAFEEQFKNYSNDELYDYLLKLNPNVDKNKLHPNNRKRVLRAIEIFLDTNEESHYVNAMNHPMYDYYIVYLNIKDREVLYDRINKRVDKMISDGLVLEAKELFDNGIYPHVIGYKELIPYFLGQVALETSIDEIKKNSRHLAKRQTTWFKNQLDTHMYEVNLDDINETVDIIYNDLIKFMNS